jgi:saccharopine dehydrogenase-like NADP-dependent oxidoreductase
VRPIDLTARLLFPMWHLPAGEGDLTVMQVVIDGHQAGARVRYTYDLLDRFDHAAGVHSMARTTGYTATVALRLLAEGKYTRHGVIPPEFLAREEGCVPFLLAGLAQRGVHYHETITRGDFA